MHWQHFKTMLWLRWQLSRNQWRRAGMINFALMIVMVTSACVMAFSSFFVALTAGIFWLERLNAVQLMLLWDAIVLIFLLVWFVSLIVEVQRSELLAMDRFLHLPISLRGTFVLNFLSSFVSIGLLFFVATGTGLVIASIAVHGWRMLWLFASLFSFIALVTSLTYQLRGWLVSLMSSKRRKQTVIACLTVCLILVTQIPNLVIQIGIGRTQKSNSDDTALYQELFRKLESGELNGEAYAEEIERVRRESIERREKLKGERLAEFGRIAMLANTFVPIGWHPWSAYSILQGRIWPAMLTSFVMALGAALSLWRSYYATMQQLTKTSPARPSKLVRSRSALGSGPTYGMLNWDLKQIREPIATVTLASWTHWIRSPEAKMAMVGPGIVLIMVLIISFSRPYTRIGPEYSGFVLLVSTLVAMFVHVTLTMNAFGTDRGAFRCYVLMPVDRKHILIGKNLSTLPVLLVSALITFGLGLYFGTPTLTVCIASLLQLVVVFCSSCLIGNFVSIYFPMAILPGTSKPAEIKLMTVLAQMIGTMLFPIALLPALLAVLAELALAGLAEIRFLPIYLIVSLIEALLALWIYSRTIDVQGRILQKSETKLISVVTSATE